VSLRRSEPELPSSISEKEDAVGKSKTKVDVLRVPPRLALYACEVESSQADRRGQLGGLTVGLITQPPKPRSANSFKASSHTWDDALGLSQAQRMKDATASFVETTGCGAPSARLRS